MRERELQQFIRDQLVAGFASQGIAVRVQRSYQPLNHAAPTIPTIVFHRIATTPAHWVYFKSGWDGEKSVEQHFSNRMVTYQFNAIVKEPKVESREDMLASDLVNMSRMILQSRPFLTECRKLGVNVLHASAVADVMVENESDNWENQPSFDLVFCTKETLTTEVPVAGVEINIYPV